MSKNENTEGKEEALMFLGGEWERGGSCKKQTCSGWEQSRGGDSAALPCQRVHSARTELLGNFDAGVGRLCWIKGFSLCWIACPLKHAELCIFSPSLTHSPPFALTHGASIHTYSIPSEKRRQSFQLCSQLKLRILHKQQQQQQRTFHVWYLSASSHTHKNICFR